MFVLAAGSSAMIASAPKTSVQADARPEPTPVAKPVEAAKPIVAWDARDIAGELQQKLARQGFYWD